VIATCSVEGIHPQSRSPQGRVLAQRSGPKPTPDTAATARPPFNTQTVQDGPSHQFRQIFEAPRTRSDKRNSPKAHEPPIFLRETEIRKYVKQKARKRWNS
jgi:hypothetical protein